MTKRNRWHDLDFGKFSSYTAQKLYEEEPDDSISVEHTGEWFGMFNSEVPHPKDLGAFGDSRHFIIQQSDSGFVGVAGNYTNIRDAWKAWNALAERYAYDDSDDGISETAVGRIRFDK